MEIRHIVLWRRTALDEMQAGALLHDNERMFKLPCPCCIETEIGLEGNIHLNPLGHVDE